MLISCTAICCPAGHLYLRRGSKGKLLNLRLL